MKEGRSTNIADWLQKDISFRKSLSTKEKEALLTQLSGFLKSGLTLYHALELVSLKSKKGSATLEKLKKDLIDGQPLWRSMEASSVFSPFDCFMVKFGEKGGELAEISAELASYYNSVNEQKKMIGQAVTYPIVILVTAFGSIFFLLQFVVPLFEDVFNRFGGELPALTRYVLAASDFLGSNLWLIVLLLIIMGSGFVVAGKNQSVKRFFQLGLLKMPLLSGFARGIGQKRITTCLLYGTRMGLPLNESVDQTRDILTFIPFKERLSILTDDIMKGISLTESLRETGIFTDIQLRLIAAGEEVNDLEMAFSTLSSQLATAEKSRIKRLNTLIEPLLILFVGAMVAVILVAMYLPMFEVSKLIR